MSSVTNGRTHPSFDWIREYIAPWMNNHTRTPAESTDMSPVLDFVGPFNSDTGTWSLWRIVLHALKRKRLFISVTKITKQCSEKCGNVFEWSCRLTVFGSWCSGEQLVSKPSRQARLMQHRSHQFPHTPHIIKAVHLFEIECDNLVSFYYSVS